MSKSVIEPIQTVAEVIFYSGSWTTVKSSWSSLR